MDLGPAREPIEANLNTLPEATWIQPLPDSARAHSCRSGRGDCRARDDPARVHRGAPAVAAAKQRAALILCEVLHWQASEVAELLETTVASVNSALQRARATLAADEQPRPTRATARRVEPRAARSLRDGVRELRHAGADVADPGGCDAVDAAVRPLAARSRRHPHVVVRARARLSRLPAGPDRRGERRRPRTASTSRRPAAATSRGRCRCSSYEAGRIVEFTFFLDTRDAVPDFRPAACSSTHRTSPRPMSAINSTSSADASRSRSSKPCRSAPSWRRARTLIVPTSGAEIAPASQTIVLRRGAAMFLL